nr:MAG TPA: hypothetical protein [Caudoviricetes sp.]
MLPKDTFPTIKSKGSEYTFLTVLGIHLYKRRYYEKLFDELVF